MEVVFPNRLIPATGVYLGLACYVVDGNRDPPRLGVVYLLVLPNNPDGAGFD